MNKAGVALSKAIIWDIDGTLSNSFNLGYSSTLTVLCNHGYSSIEESLYHAGTKYVTPMRLAWHATGDPYNDIGVILGREFDALYVTKVSNETAPFYPGIAAMLLRLQEKHHDSLPNKLKYGAVSNACSQYVRSVLKANGALDMFAVTIGADDVAEGKPSPLGLLRCSNDMHIDPSNCIYVGDSPTDGRAAAAAGMTSVGVSWGSYSLEDIKNEFSHIVNTVDELETVLMTFLDGC